MAQHGITQYQVLISCPGDINAEHEIITQVINDFNKLFGRDNKVSLVPINWKTDSYPKLGNKPQDILNKQIVDDCDAAIAIFWTRFGSPTDNYGSGTEEEIDRLIESGKQVFLYFSNAAIAPANIDSNQLNKVREYRKRMESRGLFCVYSNPDEFRTILTRHLALHFLKKIEDCSDNNSVSFNTKPILSLKSYHSGTLQDGLKYFRRTSLCGKYLDQETKKAIDMVKTIDDIILDDLTETKIPSTNPYFNNLSNLFINSAIIGTPEKISDNKREMILSFVAQQRLTVSDSFFNLGDLRRTSNLLPIAGYSFQGTDVEKKKYELIDDLYWMLKKISEIQAYLSVFESHESLILVICNTGTSYDEDIDVTISIPKNALILPDEIEKPDREAIKVIGDALIKKLFIPPSTANICEYSSYPDREIKLPSVPQINPFNTIDKYPDELEEYEEIVNTYFCCEFFDEDDSDKLKIKFSYLKQFTNMAFPAILLFSKAPTELDYEISSKYSPILAKGKLRIQEDD